MAILRLGSYDEPSYRPAAVFALEVARRISVEYGAISMAGASEQPLKPRVVDDVVCTSCGCLCDDITLEIDGGRIMEARNACPLGRDRLLGCHTAVGPACLVDGQPATLDEGIERAARILSDAQYPLVFGLGETTTEAQRAAVSLGDRIGACVDIPSDEDADATMEALQSVGQVTCTLGEIKNRADLIIVWRADPLLSHPRLFERYALEPVGEFVPAGRSDRYCVVIDEGETESAREAADQFVAIRDGGELVAIWTLRGLVKGSALASELVESETGVALETWQHLVERMKAARYGAWFYGTGGAGSRSPGLVARGIHSLIRDLNATTRFICQPLGVGGGNRVGARNVLSWHTGYPAAVSLARGYPRYGAGEFGAEDVLRRREADAAFIVSGDPVSLLSAKAREHLSRIPRVVMSSDGDRPTDGAAVVFRTATLGIHTMGTVYRMDGVPLPLRTVLESPVPSDDHILRAIGRCLRRLATPAQDGNRGA